MEEVWKDINLSSLHHYSVSTPREDLPNIPSITLPRQTNNNLRNTTMIFQDFLARPLSMNPPTKDNSHVHSSPVAPQPPATVLSLNSSSGFQFLDNSDAKKPTSLNISVLNNEPFDVLASSSELASFGKKRSSESDSNNGNGRDRRFKRMIKNRESAARSRARKQAYTNELELEVAHLQEENERLKKQQEEICRAAAAQLPKKSTLYRTSTAPF